MATREELPEIPDALDNALYEKLTALLGEGLAFPIVDAVWEVLVDQGWTAPPLRSRLELVSS